MTTPDLTPTPTPPADTTTPAAYDELVRYIAAEASHAPPQFAPAWADYLLAGYRMTPRATPPVDTRQQPAEAFKPWEGDHTDLVHVLWAVDRDGLTLHDNFDEVAARIRSSRWLRAYTAAALASSSPALPEPPAPEPGRWWRVLSVDGDLWCETSDEAEAREALAELEGPGSLWRLYVTRGEGWREVAAAGVAEEQQP